MRAQQHTNVHRVSSFADMRTAWQPGGNADGTFEGRDYVYFDLVKPTVPSIQNITPETTAMLEAAARFGVEYDGWGCGVVK